MQAANLVTGWNNVAYPVQTTRSITEALASIENSYWSVYKNNGTDSDWHLYDSTVISPFNQVGEGAFVNTLDEMSLGAYWIYATEPVTWFLGVDTPIHSAALLANNYSLPPATYYGEINSILALTEGMSVTAEINGVVCGHTTIKTLEDSTLAYNVQVHAELNGCGTNDRNIVFKVNGQPVKNDELIWANEQAWHHPLTVTSQLETQVFLPLVIKGSASASVSIQEMVGSYVGLDKIIFMIFAVSISFVTFLFVIVKTR